MRRTSIAAALLAAALLLAGCSAADSSSGDGGAPNGPVVEPEGPPIDDGSGSPTTNRDIVVTGDVTITADDPLAAAEDATRIVETAGGRIDGRTEYAPSDGDQGSAILTLRIPADKLDDVLADLKKLGRADEVAISSYDVTVEAVDLQAQIDATKASIERINSFIAKAEDIDQLIALEAQLTTRQAELGSLESQQRLLDDQIAMSTITLYLRSEAQAPATVPTDFWGGLQAGWAGLVAFGAGLLVALGVALPWLVVAGIITAVVILIVRRRRRRRTAASVSQPPPPAMPAA